MTIAAATALVVGLFIAAAAFVYLYARAPWRMVARLLRWLALACTLGIAVAAMAAEMERDLILSGRRRHRPGRHMPYKVGPDGIVIGTATAKP